MFGLHRNAGTVGQGHDAFRKVSHTSSFETNAGLIPEILFCCGVDVIGSWHSHQLLHQKYVHAVGYRLLFPAVGVRHVGDLHRGKRNTVAEKGTFSNCRLTTPF